MRPVLYRFPDWIPVLGEQPITSFGLLLLVAVLVAGGLFVRRLRTQDDAARGWDLVLVAAVGGLVGANLVHLAVHAALGLPGAGFGRAGLNGFGAVIGGTAALLWQARRLGLPPSRVAATAAAPLLLGHAIARIGSFLAGSDYGVPTTAPWGRTFPAGTPPTTPANLRSVFGLEAPAGSILGDFVRVHPTQLYEAGLALTAFVGLEIGRRRGLGGWRLFGCGLILYGAMRLLVDPVRAKLDPVAGPITVDFLLALGTVAVGAVLVGRTRSPAPLPIR